MFSPFSDVLNGFLDSCFQIYALFESSLLKSAIIMYLALHQTECCCRATRKRSIRSKQFYDNLKKNCYKNCGKFYDSRKMLFFACCKQYIIANRYWIYVWNCEFVTFCSQSRSHKEKCKKRLFRFSDFKVAVVYWTRKTFHSSAQRISASGILIWRKQHFLRAKAFQNGLFIKKYKF